MRKKCAATGKRLFFLSSFLSSVAIITILLLITACSPEENPAPAVPPPSEELSEDFSEKTAEDACTEDSEPVCGNDGKTYVNECWAKKDKVEVAYEGECKKPKMCSDSDKGINLMAAGTTSKGEAIKTDLCLSIYNVQEFFCENNEISSAINTCPVGHRCVNGACVQECTDSDNGNDVFNAGFTLKGSLSKSDACSGSNIIEYFCEDNNIRSSVSSCQTGYACKEGACIQECTDSDGGIDYEIVGTATKGSETKSDTCDGERIIEFYCLNNELKSKTVDCLQNEICLTGACTPFTTQ